MPLHRLKDYYPNYKETLADGQMHSIDSYSIYTQGGEKVGSAKDILVDDSGRFRYLVVDTGPWIFGKSVLMPIGLANFDYQNDRIHINGLSKEQVENLPEYKDDMVIDESHEERVRSGYQPLGQQRSGRQFMGQTYAAGQPVRQVEDVRGIEGSAGMTPVEGAVRAQQTGRTTQSDRNIQPVQGNVGETRTARETVYDREPQLYGLSEQDNHGPLRLYEERLIAHRTHNKVGEVSVGKRVVTETAEVSEPIDRERVVIERHNVTGDVPATGVDAPFENQEVARMEVYEDQVDIEKQPFVREEVTLRKETDHETVRSREQVRREELDVNTQGNPRVDNQGNPLADNQGNPRTDRR